MTIGRAGKARYMSMDAIRKGKQLVGGGTGPWMYGGGGDRKVAAMNVQPAW